MKPTAIARAAAALTCCAASAAVAAAVVPAPGSGDYRIPTSYESAVLGRRILALTPLGTISTVFPEDDDDSVSAGARRPAGLGGMPYGLMEYIADCEEGGNPTILAVTIGTTFRNVAAGSNVSLAVEWTPPHPPAKRIQGNRERRSWLSFLGLTTTTTDTHDSDDDDDYDYGYDDYDSDSDDEHRATPLPYSAANLPRFSLLGRLERIEGGDDRQGEVGRKLAECFVRTHPDARYWLPGNRIHESHFVRLVVEQVYWVGGFGDRAFIGWIPAEEW